MVIIGHTDCTLVGCPIQLAELLQAVYEDSPPFIMVQMWQPLVKSYKHVHRVNIFGTWLRGITAHRLNDNTMFPALSRRTQWFAFPCAKAISNERAEKYIAAGREGGSEPMQQRAGGGIAWRNPGEMICRNPRIPPAGPSSSKDGGRGQGRGGGGRGEGRAAEGGMKRRMGKERRERTDAATNSSQWAVVTTGLVVNTLRLLTAPYGQLSQNLSLSTH